MTENEAKTLLKSKYAIVPFDLLDSGTISLANGILQIEFSNLTDAFICLDALCCTEVTSIPLNERELT